ncbi:methyltransferase FkbM family [Chthoniobacter flavus Ellin428]|uniref:Methyltransferase FkbM family n=1 Tax=Chthoniobacter flavus Ellin428 TaxID=497964 RepID=B4CZX0_9BACT|nr:FkbM family methyltransferase [Chthoniobacter flavus]EDY20284.1 methyltransferase FkbM family [Chthoniobacter flavus Ellin428]TCO94181.1 FkbM family methyltransferase [Chthoniobacter flavus]
MFKLLKRMIPEPIKARLRGPRKLQPDAVEVFAQEGEDMILARIFHRQAEGFYVDVGAHHPRAYSNTYLLYRKGWRGINIDPLPGSMTKFNEIRPRDINLEVAVSDVEQTLNYHQFEGGGINTLSDEVVEQRMSYHDGPKSDFKFQYLGKKTVQARLLKDILADHLPAGQRIDMLSIDVEGHEFNVLRSNDWEKYSPTLILIEDASLLTLDQLPQSELANFLGEKGYAPFCRTPLTMFFVKRTEVVSTPQGARLRSIA